MHSLPRSSLVVALFVGALLCGQPASCAESLPAPIGEFVPVDTSLVMGSPDPLPPLAVEIAYPNLEFVRPLVYTHAGDGSGRVFVGTQRGEIFVFPNRRDVTAAKLFLDLRDVVSRDKNEEGLMGVAFHPGYRENGRFFVYYSARGLQSVVAEFTVARNDPDRAVRGSEKEILRVKQPYWNHNGGSLEFGSDGKLYIALGDGGSANDPHGHGQNLATLLGSILRIDVDRRDAGRAYAIPPDNPFVSRAGARGEIWAYGLRNPWKMHFDRLTGALWIGDVGQGLWEEIDIIVKGGNYGWNAREGRHAFNPKTAPSTDALIDPVHEYHHRDGKSITGGVVYRGERLPELFGAYLYADYASFNVWALRYDGKVATTNELIATTKLPVSAFGEDEDGEVCFCAFDGHIWRFRRAAPEATARADSLPRFPRRLSETGLFVASSDGLEPAPGLIPYSVNVPLWSDHAAKRRWLALPKAGSVEFSARGPWKFPVGTVLVKTFALPRRRGGGEPAKPGDEHLLETRLLVHADRGWTGYTYRWNADRSDATLLDAALETTVEVATPAGDIEQSWYFPSRSDCATCHTEQAGSALGLNTRQLNRVHDYGGARAHQLAVLDGLGVFTERLGAVPGLEAYPDWEHDTVPLDRLARAYLEVNCAMCHAPGGAASAQADLRYHTPLADAFLVDHEPGQGRLGPADSKVIAPGHPERSELLLRMNRRGPQQMPTFATALRDEKALRVVRQWIEGLGTATAAPKRRATAFRRERRDATKAAKDAMENRAPPALFIESWHNTAGEPLVLDRLRGKVVLIDFWGTWCGPCRAAIPKLKKLWTKHRDRGLVVLGIHTSSKAEKVAAFVESEGIDYPIAVDDAGQTVKAWKVDGYPDYYLIDREGKLRVADLANREVERAVEALLAE